jgi:hypothetical protein
MISERLEHGLLEVGADHAVELADGAHRPGRPTDDTGQ